ncbi:hypothetical protein HETIRDRAFT_157510 [Heterobasidion irregulare TC 32-1]|uniref:Peptidase C14 caspase domain-containing protein n=1 Tax=Heterobasidion irregulare (strain TC 32-1) TaxID=747525 RepID=W4JRP5_HETIT|nr:uncharacterized protein HETIRDRAFT_157510 [Heterobasidion irregulare TC 32-1]ETW75546.1 hypothetical protein HETIRDRAFT_157510 [Heterobasidion irregulare TC 32-1]
MQHPDFQLSRCTGRKKALCIGINYVGQRNELRGCVNDASSVYHFLVDYQHYKKEDIVYLSDEAQDPRSHPTRANMLNAMRWLVQDAHPHDSLFFHYSGHGGQTKDLDGDEVDGLDEVIFPVDYEHAGTIIDDVLHETMVKPLPPGCRLTSCHSGSYHSNGRVKQGQVTRRFKERKSTPADVISWSGCMDSQTSADTVENGLAVGAMSYAFIKVLKRNPEISYMKLLQGLREILNKRYSQKPQLSSSHRMPRRGNGVVCPAVIIHAFMRCAAIELG